MGRGVQIVNFFDLKLALWFFPLHGISEVTKKNFSLLAQSEDPPLEIHIFALESQNRDIRE